jgi:ribose transport system permease protein
MPAEPTAQITIRSRSTRALCPPRARPRASSEKVIVFALMGLLSGLAALFQISRLEAADPNAGSGIELQVIAAVVIGGTSLMGGRGSVISTFFGVLIISVLAAGLAQIGANEPTKRIITGAVIVVAVVLDTYRSKRRIM